MKSFRVFLVLFSFCSSVFAGNSKLEKIQHYFTHQLEQLISGEVAHAISEQAIWFERDIKGYTYQIGEALYEMRDRRSTYAEGNFKNARYRHTGFLKVAYGAPAISQRVQREKDSAIDLKKRMTREHFCKSKGRVVSFARIGYAPEYREMDIDVPLPKKKHQTGAFESEHKPAGETGAKVFNTFAGSGCAVGAVAGTFVPVLGNILGCLLGAATGAALGAGAGAATTAIMTHNYNQEEIDAFMSAYDKEEDREKALIREVDEWLKKHPFTAESMGDRAEAFCLQKADWSSFDKLAPQVEVVLQKADDAIAEIMGPHEQEMATSIRLREDADNEQKKIDNAYTYVEHFDTQVKAMLEGLKGCDGDEACIRSIETQVNKKLKSMEADWIAPEYLQHAKVLDRKQYAADSIQKARNP